MKKAVFTIALILGLQLSLTAVAQNNDLIALRVPHFVRPLVEKWVTEYQKSNINVDFKFVSGKSQDNNNTISFTTDDDAVAFARFAVLPITTKASKAQQLIGFHSLNAKKLKSLFFEKEDFDEEEEDNDNEQALHIYTGSGQQSVSRFIASYFKQQTIKVKRYQATTVSSIPPLAATLWVLPSTRFPISLTCRAEKCVATLHCSLLTSIRRVSRFSMRDISTRL